MTPDDPHGIEHEPHLSPGPFSGDPTAADPSEAKASELFRRELAKSTEADAVEHTVWSEPALAAELAGNPDEHQLTYRGWLTKNIAETTWSQSLVAMFLVALAAGPWAVLGAFYVGSYSGNLSGNLFSILMFTVFGPVAEEVAKVAAALWVVEKRPYLFRSLWQVFLCAACGGLAFAAIENLLYIYVYVPKHTAEFVHFRWTVCVFLHVSCSLVAGVGLARIWDNAIRNLHPPRLAMGVPWFVIAMVGHGLYNLTVTVASAAGWLDLGMPQPTAE